MRGRPLALKVTAPSSDRAEGPVLAVDGSHAPRTTIHHHSINITVPGGDLEALEHQFAAKPVLLLFCSRQRYPSIYGKHLTDFSEL